MFAVCAGMNLKSLSNQALLDRTSELARDERKITLEILHHLREIERRKLFAELGYPSLFEYCVKHLGYSEASAQRRIASMRLLKEVPDLEESVQKGQVSISTLAKAQSFFKKEKAFQTFSSLTKKHIIEKVSGKSNREVERTLLSLSLSPEMHFKEKVKIVSPSKVEMTFFADNELQIVLEKIRSVLSHKLESGTLTEMISFIAKAYWEKIDPCRAIRAKKLVSRAQVHFDTITTAIKRAVWKRDNGECAFTNTQGKKCKSTYRLQFDHFPIPKAKGGPSTEENLRLTCFQHNAFHAVQKFGLKKMERYQKQS
jgi:hypothetical protein